MSVGQEVELNGTASKRKKSKALKGLNGRLAFAIAAAAIGSSFQHGYNTGVVNAPQKLIEDWIRGILQERSPPETKVEQQEVTIIFSVIVSIFCIGGMIGGCVSGYLADRFGRKGGLLLNTVFVLVAAALEGSAKTTESYEMLIAGRFFIGLNSGINAGLVPMYLAEISPVRLRGASGTVYQLVITIAILMSQILGINSVLGTEDHWPILLAVTLLPAIFQLATLPFCPESPKYLLLTQGKEVAAERALSWLRGSIEVHDEMDDMKNEYESQKITPKVSIKEIFVNSALRIPILIAIVIMIGQQLSGINAVMFFSTKIFKMAQMNDENAQYATLVVGVVNVAITLVSLVLVEKAGRKTLLLLGFGGMTFIAIFLTISLNFAEKSVAASYVSIVLVLLFVILFAIGPGSIPWFIVNELFNQTTRTVAASIAVAVNWTANFIVGLGFLPLQEVLENYVFIVFAVFLLFLTIFVWFKVPETKNKTIEEISAMFRQRSYE